MTTQTWRLLFGNVCKSNPVHSGSKSSLLNNLCHFQLSPDPDSGHAAVWQLSALKSIYVLYISQNGSSFIYLLTKIIKWAEFEGRLAIFGSRLNGPLLETLPLKLFPVKPLFKLMPKNIESTYITSKEERFANIPGGSFSILFWCNCLKQNQ